MSESKITLQSVNNTLSEAKTLVEKFGKGKKWLLSYQNDLSGEIYILVAAFVSDFPVTTCLPSKLTKMSYCIVLYCIFNIVSVLKLLCISF